MKTLPLSARFKPSIVWSIPLVIIAVSAVIQGMDWVEALRFERSAFLAGEIWRLLTGNLAHLTWSHLGLNAAGLLMIWVFFDREFSVDEWLLLLIICGLGVTGGLLWLNPQLIWYVGLSGLLHGLFIAGAIQTFRSEPLFSGVLLGGFLLKLVYEQFQGALPSTAELSGGPVVVDSHLYGAITGLIAGILFLIIKPHRQKTRH